MTPERVPSTSLAELIELEVVPRRVWRADEMGPVLLHELSQPLPLPLPSPASPAAVAGGTTGAGAGVGAGAGDRSTMRSLLHDTRTPLESLVRIKQYAKAARRDAGSHLPEDVAAVMYAMAVAAALLGHGRLISSSGRATIAAHLGWAARRPWLDPESRALLCGAADRLRQDGAPVQPGA